MFPRCHTLDAVSRSQSSTTMPSAIWSSLHTLDVVKRLLGKNYVESGIDYIISPFDEMDDRNNMRDHSLADSIAKLAVVSPSARDVSACAIELNFNEEKAEAVARITQNGGLSNTRLKAMRLILQRLKNDITSFDIDILSNNAMRCASFSPLFNLGRWLILSYVRQCYSQSCE